jgi:hypothetical protein
MRYQIRVAGKVFEGTDHRNLLKRAVEAKRQAVRKAGCGLRSHSLIEPPAAAAAGA